jgi:hypothetical protein
VVDKPHSDDQEKKTVNNGNFNNWAKTKNMSKKRVIRDEDD